LFEHDSVLTAYIKLMVSVYVHRQFCFDYIFLHSSLCTTHYYTCILHVITFVHVPNQFSTHYFIYLNCPQKCLSNEINFKATIISSTTVSKFRKNSNIICIRGQPSGFLRHVGSLVQMLNFLHELLLVTMKTEVAHPSETSEQMV
jgi:hypothetical protein